MKKWWWLPFVWMVDLILLFRLNAYCIVVTKIKAMSLCLLPLIFELILKSIIFNFRSQFRSIFRILPNIEDAGSCKNSKQLFGLDYFSKKLHLRCMVRFAHWKLVTTCGKTPSQLFDRVLNSSLYYFCKTNPYLFSKFD